ncbi:Fic family protein [Campylobacter gastrosuis]|uniref:Fic family protein n=1 Tax=Campylobacter gastrosuis TaxID=2974576 RepID=A0ABT7HQZ4_9BACT|nr:Fic family protein [Campylobacter gastrosuis]MDL0089280.1 Fic family protein [Campylobacter gastrosuis]
MGYLQDIHRLVGRDIVLNSSFLRTANVKISGTNYAPILPVNYEVKAKINEISSKDNKLDVALDMMLYIARSQLFFNANKRTAMLRANKILIQNGLGILWVSKDNMTLFFTKLVKFYETAKRLRGFVKKNA